MIGRSPERIPRHEPKHAKPGFLERLLFPELGTGAIWISDVPDLDGPVIRPDEPYTQYALGEDPVLLAAERLKTDPSFAEIWNNPRSVYEQYGIRDRAELEARIREVLEQDAEVADLRA